MQADRHDHATQELTGLLDETISACGVKTVTLVTRDGSLVAQSGDTGYVDTTALAALLGAMFTATREVARMVGEEHFSILLQQGEKRHIHISLISDRFMLACIFEDISRLGRIRLHTRRQADRMAELAGIGWQDRPTAPAAVADRPPSQPTVEFREYALDLIDRIFSD
jgi:predicted regulator of Ras-like GTPase activity (Roadblock/LC7/MglB family)